MATEIKSNMNNLSDIHCPGCRGLRHKSLGDLRVPVESQEPHPQVLREMVGQTIPSRLLKCEDCGLVFRENSLTEDQLRTLYSHLPEKNWDYEPGLVGSWKAATDELLKRYASQQDVRILDIGAYDGTFLSLLPNTWEKNAVEPSTSTAEALGRRGIRRIAKFIDDTELDREAGRFDCITLLDVFEHLPNPQAALNRISSLLKPGGTLLVSSGNSSHWTMRRLRGRHWYFHSIQHLSVPSVQVLRTYAARASFRFVSCVYHSHQLRGTSDKLDQFVETIYWYFRLRGSWFRGCATVIQKLPRYRHLLHREDSSKCDALNDHLLVVLEKLAQSS